jgi:hypothetical protein
MGERTRASQVKVEVVLEMLAVGSGTNALLAKKSR